MDAVGESQLHSSQDTSKAPPYAQGHSSPADTSRFLARKRGIPSPMVSLPWPSVSRVPDMIAKSEIEAYRCAAALVKRFSCDYKIFNLCLMIALLRDPVAALITFGRIFNSVFDELGRNRSTEIDPGGVAHS